MSSALTAEPNDSKVGRTSTTQQRHGVAVWCDRAILGHGVAAVVGRIPDVGPPLWIGDGPHEPPRPHHLVGVEVLVAVWDGLHVWSSMRRQLPQWLATGASVVLVGLPDEGEAGLDHQSQPRLQWCSPQATAAELSAAIIGGIEVARTGFQPSVRTQPSVVDRSQPPLLSVQEQRVLELVTTGLKVSAVARRLDVSPHTVHTYLRRIRRKLADAGTPVASPLELYRAAALWRLVDAPASRSYEFDGRRQALGSTG